MFYCFFSLLGCLWYSDCLVVYVINLCCYYSDCKIKHFFPNRQMMDAFSYLSRSNFINAFPLNYEFSLPAPILLTPSLPCLKALKGHYRPVSGILPTGLTCSYPWLLGKDVFSVFWHKGISIFIQQTIWNSLYKCSCEKGPLAILWPTGRKWASFDGFVSNWEWMYCEFCGLGNLRKWLKKGILRGWNGDFGELFWRGKWQPDEKMRSKVGEFGHASSGACYRSHAGSVSFPPWERLQSAILATTKCHTSNRKVHN